MTGEVYVDSQEVAGLGGLTKIIIDWISDSSGVVTSDSIDAVGYLREVETIPGLNGDRVTECPSSYNLTVTDSYGYDLLGGKLTSRSATVAQRKIAANPMWVDDSFVINIASAGNTKKGRLILWFDRNLNG